MLSVLYFWLGLDPGLVLVSAGLGLKAKNYGLGLVDVALTSALLSCTFSLVNIPAYIQHTHKFCASYDYPIVICYGSVKIKL